MRLLFHFNLLGGLSVNYVTLIIVFVSHLVLSQNQQIELFVANDKIVFTDRYYTSGLHLSYRKVLKESLSFLRTENNKLQFNITIANETYSPENLTSFDNDDFDRPYAGWFSGKAEIGIVKRQSALFFAVESGITGEQSLAGRLQIKFHELLNIESRPSWADEINFNWLLNFQVVQVSNFEINKWSNIQNLVSASIGSKDTFFANEVYCFFGKFSDFQNSSRLHLLDTKQTKEFFGFISGGYKYVALNALIQGNPFNNNDVFTAVALRHVLKFGAGAVLRKKKNIVKLGFYYNTAESLFSKSHVYGAATYGFIF